MFPARTFSCRPFNGEGSTATRYRKTVGKIKIGFLQPAVVAFVFLVVSCSKPAPLQTSFRRSALDPAGLVLQVRNTGARSLSCVMTASNKINKQARRYSFSLAPYAATEIGILESDWSFRSGEHVGIAVEGHRDIDFEVP